MTPAAAPPLWNTRLAVVVTAGVAFLATLIVYTPGSWVFACVVLLTDGAKAGGWLLGAIALGAVLLRAMGVRANPLLHVATAGGLGLGVFGLIGLGLGLAGRLNHGVALALPLGSAAAWTADHLRRRGLPDERKFRTEVTRWLGAQAGCSWLWLIPVASLATAALAACVMPGDLWKPLDPHPYDVVSYHLQVPREWYEAGRIIPLAHNVFSYFPFNVEMQFLLLMHAAGGPWAGMYACQLLNVGYAVLLVCAVVGSTDDESPGGASAASSGAGPLIAAAVVSSVPWLMMLASVAYVESALMLYTALCLVWATRCLAPPTEPSGSAAGSSRVLQPIYSSPEPAAEPLGSVFRKNGSIRVIILSGIFAGLAAGTKITAVPMLVMAVPVALLMVKGRRAAVQSALFLFAAGAVLAPWLIRTAVWSGGNPLFPVAMSALGHGRFSPEQITRFVTAHSPTPAEHPWTARLRITWTGVLAQWQFGYLLLPSAAVALVLRRHDPAVLLLGLTGLVIFVVWIGFTHLLGRFLIQWVPIAGLLLARMRWGRAWPAGLALALGAAGLGWGGVFSPLTSTTRDPVKSTLIGVQDLSFMMQQPQDLTDMMGASNRVALVGDAGAFLYQIPMSRLRYRTVFDVPGNVADPVRAWAGPDVIGDPNWLLVINPSEIARLHATYFRVPPLPPAWSDRQQPFVLSGTECR